jgi:hypothetical protein
VAHHGEWLKQLNNLMCEASKEAGEVVVDTLLLLPLLEPRRNRSSVALVTVGSRGILEGRATR